MSKPRDRREYYKKRRIQNREKINKWNNAYYHRNKKRINARLKKKYDENPEYREHIRQIGRVSSRKHKLRRKLTVIDHYSQGKMCCACCGEKTIDFLTIDDISGTTHKLWRKTNKRHEFYRWLINNNFPSGFQILCFNCNCAKGHCGECPHMKMRRGELEQPITLEMFNK